MINGSTSLVGIIGNPVSHSLSPLMHNAAFKALGLDWVYVPLPVVSANLQEAIKGLASLGFAGANVTVPFKEKIIPFLDQLSDEAAQIGAVNTILVKDGVLIGENTDFRGFLSHLQELGFDPLGCRALILGSGGSARAVVHALAYKKVQITICSRNSESASKIAIDLQKNFSRKIKRIKILASVSELNQEIDLIVNTTPVGMEPDTESSPWPEIIPFPECKLTYDLIYRPSMTRFLQQAQNAGSAAVNGLGMLVHQAARSFEMWTKIPAPIEVMRQAVTCSNF